MQADSPSLGEPVRGSHQGPGAWAVWSCWGTAAQWVPGRLAFGRVSISFLLSIYFVCQQTPALWLYPEVCMFVNWGGPSRVLTQGIHPCPAIPRVVPGCRSRSPPLGLSSMTKAMWKAGEVSSLKLVFTPSSRQPPSVPPTPQKIQPRVFRTCGKTPWNLFVCCFHKHRLAESGFFRFCHIFCEFWQQVPQKVPTPVCFQHGRKEHPRGVSPAQPSHSPLPKQCSEVWARCEFRTADTTPVTHKDTTIFAIKFWFIHLSFSQNGSLESCVCECGQTRLYRTSHVGQTDVQNCA